MILVVIPRAFPDPLQLDSAVGPDFDRGGFGGRHRRLHRLHEILCVAHEHFRRVFVLLAAHAHAHHGRLHRGYDLELRGDRRDALGHVEQVESDAFVGALVGEVAGDSRHLLGGVGDGLGAGDQLALAGFVVVARDHLAEFGHEGGHAFGRGHDVVIAARPLTHFLVQIMRGKLK